MRKIMMIAAFALTLGLAGSAMAADLENASGQSCGADTGTWHFVNNQTDGASRGSLTAEWSSGDSCTVSAYKVKQRVQHFRCVASGELLDAMTNLPGRLVLSDFTCESKCEKDCEPPPTCEKDCEPPK